MSKSIRKPTRPSAAVMAELAEVTQTDAQRAQDLIAPYTLVFQSVAKADAITSKIETTLENEIATKEQEANGRRNHATAKALIRFTLMCIKIGRSNVIKKTVREELVRQGLTEERAGKWVAAAFHKKTQEKLTEGAKPDGSITQTEAEANAKEGNCYGISDCEKFRKANRTPSSNQTPKPVAVTHPVVLELAGIISNKAGDIGKSQTSVMLNALARAVGAAGLV